MSLYAGLGLGFDEVKPASKPAPSVAPIITAAPTTFSPAAPAAPAAPAPSSADGWSSSRGLMMSATLKRKRVAEMAAKAAPAPAAKRRAGGASIPTAVLVTDLRASANASAHAGGGVADGPGEAAAHVSGPHQQEQRGEEYDPFHPNDYDECLARKVEQEEMARAAREFERKQEQRRRRRRERHDGSDRSSDDGSDRSSDEGVEGDEGGAGGDERRGRDMWREAEPPVWSRNSAAIAPPPSVLADTTVTPAGAVADAPRNNMQALFGQSGEEAFLARARLSQPNFVAAPPARSFPPPPPPAAPAAPTIPPELDAAFAVDDGPPGLDMGAEFIEDSGPVDPSAVVLLTNLVAPGQVDDDLGPETADECKKYGPVLQCLVREFPAGPQFSSEDCVRVFVQFATINAAVKAVSDLNGRMFGGRAVKAALFDRARFLRGDYAAVLSRH